MASLDLAGFYGASDTLQVSAGYGLGGQPFEAKGILAVGGACSLTRGKLSIAADGDVRYALQAEVAGVRLGLNVRYAVTPRISILVSGKQLQAVVVSPDVGGRSQPKPIRLTLPLAVGFQATKNVYAFALTLPASIGIANSSTGLFGRVGIPLAVGAFVSPSNKLDLGVSSTIGDLQHASTLWDVELVARVYAM